LLEYHLDVSLVLSLSLSQFTEHVVNVTVPPESEATFTYTMNVDHRHEPTTLLCSSTIFYESDETGKKYSDTFFFASTKLSPAPPEIDTKK